MCAIKLFGKTIALPSHTDQAGAGRAGGGGVKGCTNNEEINTESKPNAEDKCDEPITSSTTTTSSAADRETQVQKTPPSAAAADDAVDDDDHHQEEEEEEKDPETDQEEQQQDEKPALKKPDKILPCPRCNSMDTKFCYYNNYNVNQPRHFCKNCQRYWTAGGTMRNVPVGAGRRKNKNAAAVAAAAAAAAHYRHLTMTDAGAALKPKGTVLSFGSDMPLSESMASVLDLAEKSMKKKKKKTCNRSSGFQRMEEHAEEQSTGSSATNSNSAADDDEGNNGASLREPAAIRNCQGLPPHLLYIGSSSPWPYPWNLPPPTPPTSAPFCGSTFPIPIYPATAYWGGCGAWTIPWLAPLQGGSPSPTSTPPGYGPPNSPTTTTLGKHTREGNVLHSWGSISAAAADTVVNEQSSQEKCLWIPKTLRIDDPEEAAKSSIWATMGFSKKNDKADGFSSLGGGLFRSFQAKTELWSRRVEASQTLHANPAALSRSIEFQESS